MEFEDIFTEATLPKLDLYNFSDEVEEVNKAIQNIR